MLFNASKVAWTKLWRYLPSVKTAVFFLRPEVPGFCPSIGAVFSVETLSAPKPGAAVRSMVVFSYRPGGKVLGSSDSFLIVTLPTNTFFDDSRTSPFTVNDEHDLREGAEPPIKFASSCWTNLYFLESSETLGAAETPSARTGTELTQAYASDLNSNRSLHFLTGAKRVRGTTMACAEHFCQIGPKSLKLEKETTHVHHSWRRRVSVK